MNLQRTYIKLIIRQVVLLLCCIQSPLESKWLVVLKLEKVMTRIYFLTGVMLTRWSVLSPVWRPENNNLQTSMTVCSLLETTWS